MTEKFCRSIILIELSSEAATTLNPPLSRAVKQIHREREREKLIKRERRIEKDRGRQKDRERQKERERERERERVEDRKRGSITFNRESERTMQQETTT